MWLPGSISRRHVRYMLVTPPPNSMVLGAVVLAVVLLFAGVALVLILLVGSSRREPDDISLSISLCGLLMNILLRSQGRLPKKWGGARGGGKVPVPSSVQRSLSALRQEWRWGW